MFVSKKKFEELEQAVRDLELETIQGLMKLEAEIRAIKHNMKLRGVWK